MVALAPKVKAALLLVLSALCFSTYLFLQPRGPHNRGHERETLSSLSFGAARALAVDTLWVGLVDAFERGDYVDVPILASAVTEVDPHFVEAYAMASWAIAVNTAPRMATVQARWAFVRQGIWLLHRGLEHNPGSWQLHFEIGQLVYHLVDKEAGYSQRFVADRELNPQGLAPIRYAYEHWLLAQGQRDHSVAVDWRLLNATLRFAHAMAPTNQGGSRSMLHQAQNLLDHVVTEHDHVATDVVSHWQVQLEALGRELSK